MNREIRIKLNKSFLIARKYSNCSIHITITFHDIFIDWLVDLLVRMFVGLNLSMISASKKQN